MNNFANANTRAFDQWADRHLTEDRPVERRRRRINPWAVVLTLAPLAVVALIWWDILSV